MVDATHHLGLGGAHLTLVPARPLGQLSAAMFVPGNLLGVMAAGLAGEVRVRAGQDVEAELLGQRPLSLGRAYATNPGKLSDACVTTIIHGIVSTAPGEPASPRHAEQALRSGLLLVDELGVRSITIPVLEVDSSARNRADQGRTFGTLVAGHLRRRSRLRKVNIAGLDAEFLAGVYGALIESGAIPIAGPDNMT